MSQGLSSFRRSLYAVLGLGDRVLASLKDGHMLTRGQDMWCIYEVYPNNRVILACGAQGTDQDMPWYIVQAHHATRTGHIHAFGLNPTITTEQATALWVTLVWPALQGACAVLFQHQNPEPLRMEWTCEEVKRQVTWPQAGKALVEGWERSGPSLTVWTWEDMCRAAEAVAPDVQAARVVGTDARGVWTVGLQAAVHPTLTALVAPHYQAPPMDAVAPRSARRIQSRRPDIQVLYPETAPSLLDWALKEDWDVWDEYGAWFELWGLPCAVPGGPVLQLGRPDMVEEEEGSPNVFANVPVVFAKTQRMVHALMHRTESEEGKKGNVRLYFVIPNRTTGTVEVRRNARHVLDLLQQAYDLHLGTTLEGVYYHALLDKWLSFSFPT